MIRPYNYTSHVSIFLRKFSLSVKSGKKSKYSIYVSRGKKLYIPSYSYHKTCFHFLGNFSSSGNSGTKNIYSSNLCSKGWGGQHTGLLIIQVMCPFPRKIFLLSKVRQEQYILKQPMFKRGNVYEIIQSNHDTSHMFPFEYIFKQALFKGRKLYSHIDNTSHVSIFSENYHPL